MITTIVHILKNILFPEHCVLCKTENTSLCQKCIHSLQPCQHGPREYIHPLFSYSDLHVKKIIHALKYNHTYSIIEHLKKHIEELTENILEEHIIMNKDSCIIVPVPEMKKHTTHRGGNHVALLGRDLARAINIHYDDTSIIRTNTIPQRTLSRKERLLNMCDGFKVINEKSLKNKIVLLVDDVVTTGATLDSLRTNCIKAGAQEVYAITLAH